MSGKIINQFLHNLSLGYVPEAAFDKAMNTFDASGVLENRLQWPANLNLSLIVGVVPGSYIAADPHDQSSTKRGDTNE